MDENNDKIKNNIFLTRGLTGAPEQNQRNNPLFKHGCCKLDSCEWLNGINIPSQTEKFSYVEIRFKNSHKDFFKISDGYELKVGDIVAVEASPGHDIGIVTLTGETARIQMRKKLNDFDPNGIKQVYRRARVSDLEKWVSAVKREDQTMRKTKSILDDLGLEMKMNDIEYQGDNTKAIFYYTAEDRVDFRQLIKILAEEFRIRIEMKQIGVRQEAARIGGIGSCGRELCCGTWITKFQSVTTNTARTQQLSLNPQKLAGQCGKLKCCLNFENDTYLDAMREFPESKITLKTKKGEAVHHKTDVFNKVMWYSYIEDKTNIMAIHIDQVKMIINMNEKNRLPENLEDFSKVTEKKVDFENGFEQGDLSRFD
ncbi:MAG: regulatory iron-sulfur-containing complex subunit RicT [Bacteroidales bacterium]